ncbi:MAG: cytochrome d ubiquinol oxidase subunit II [Gammaproteobacteria bacterium]
MESLATFLHPEILMLLWWGLLGALVLGFSLGEGANLGIAMVQPFLARSEEERRVLRNAIGGSWAVHQLWLLLLLVNLLAAWPQVFATALAQWHAVWVVLALAFLLRAMAFELRNRAQETGWRASWDWALFASALIPAFLLGVLGGNLFLGSNFRVADQALLWSGGLLDLFNPFALLMGILTVCLALLQGGLHLLGVTVYPLYDRSRRLVMVLSAASMLLIVILSLWLALAIPGFYLDEGRIQNEVGAWVWRFVQDPLWMFLPVVMVAAWAMVLWMTWEDQFRSAQRYALLGTAALLACGAISLFPFLLPSHLDPASSLLVTSDGVRPSILALLIGLHLIFLPPLLLLIVFLQRRMRGRLTVASLRRNARTLY